MNSRRSTSFEEKPKFLEKGVIKHGKTKHPLYRIWSAMKQRCLNPNNYTWNWYGGRGISVCERWKDFANFYQDVKDLYMPGLTIDRINPAGNYEPGNVRWITRSEQAKNRRTRKDV